MLPLPALEIGASSQAEEPATAFVWEAHGLSHGTSQSCLQGESSPESVKRASSCYSKPQHTSPSLSGYSFSASTPFWSRNMFSDSARVACRNELIPFPGSLVSRMHLRSLGTCVESLLSCNADVESLPSELWTSHHLLIHNLNG